MDDLEKIQARFAALKTLSGLHATLLAAFREKNKADGLKYGDIGRAHGDATWGEIARVAEGKSVCCDGKAFKAVVSYTGETELGNEITACIARLSGDTWRGLALFDATTIDSLQLVWEAYTRDAEDLGVEGFSQIFPEEMQPAVLGTLNRKREDASYFAQKEAQLALFEFLAGGAYDTALKNGFVQLAAQRALRAEAWKEPIEKLSQLYVGRAAQAKALKVHPGTLNNLLHGVTSPELHQELLQKALDLVAGAEESTKPVASTEPTLPAQRVESFVVPAALAEVTVNIGLSALKSSIRALEDWQEATESSLPFSPKQRDDMARYAARLIRLSGLDAPEVSLAITGEPVSMDDLLGVFGAIQQEDRRRS